MGEEKKDKAKAKKPSALKREIQSEKKRVINKSFKSSVRTALRDLDDALVTKEKEKVSKTLNQVNSILDKGVKKGIIKKNKASRTKSRAKIKTLAIAK